jgi:hypothetical protein
MPLLYLKGVDIMLKINGAWYLDTFPMHTVLEKENGELAKFFINPFRELQETDLTTYKGYHPRKCKGQPLPDYLYHFYGLEKNEESATEVIHTRLTPSEKAKIEAYASNLEPKKTVSEVIRDYIRSL